MMSKIKWKLIFIQFQLANTVKPPWTSYSFVSLLSDIRDFQFLGPQIQSGKYGATVMVNWVVLLARLDSFNVMVRAHLAQKGAFYIWVGNATNPNAWWFEKAAMGFVLCHIAVIFSSVKSREETLILTDIRLIPPTEITGRHHSMHFKSAAFKTGQAVGRFYEVTMSDNVKGKRSAGTGYLWLFHFLWGEVPVPSCLLVSSRETPDETQREVKPQHWHRNFQTNSAHTRLCATTNRASALGPLYPVVSQDPSVRKQHCI